MSLNYTEVLSVLNRGLEYLPKAIQLGKNVLPVITAMTTLATSAANGTATQSEADAVDQELDDEIAKFNRPI